MQFKSLFVLIAVPILAVALPGGQPPPKTQTTTVVVPTTITVVQPQPPAPTAPSGVSQCNTGSIQCCNSVQSASSSTINLLTGLLGIVLGPVTGNVGVTCSPLSVVGVGGNSCTAQPVCCTGNSFNGVIVTGCSPININL